MGSPHPHHANMRSSIACQLLLSALALSQAVSIGNAAPALAAAPAPAPAPAVAPAPAAPVTPAPRYNFGPAFFGPGVNNPAAVLPYRQHLAIAEQAALGNPNLRVFVPVDGEEIMFTDQYGREVEVVNALGDEPFENVIITPAEQQRVLTEIQNYNLNL